MKPRSDSKQAVLSPDASGQLVTSTHPGIGEISARGKKLESIVTTVFIADASRMACQLMASALGRSRYRFNVIGYATDRAGVRGGIATDKPSVAVISAHLKDGVFAGLDAIRDSRTTCPGTSIIGILDSTTAPIVVETFRAGATGILSREEPFEVMSKCIKAVHQGQVWASSKELRFALDALMQASPHETISFKGPKRTSILTKREDGIVQLVAEGLTNCDIARRLGLSENTVRNYLFRIFNKIGTSNRLELALYALNRKQSPSL
jgi:DNA-binding NarL/FixJ family response regulator